LPRSASIHVHWICFFSDIEKFSGSTCHASLNVPFCIARTSEAAIRMCKVSGQFHCSVCLSKVFSSPMSSYDLSWHSGAGNDLVLLSVSRNSGLFSLSKNTFFVSAMQFSLLQPSHEMFCHLWKLCFRKLCNFHGEHSIIRTVSSLRNRKQLSSYDYGL
jgi:hypothetical protein